NLVLLILGLAISIPLIIYGSTLLLKLMNRYPIIILIGGRILGWVAGEMAVTDPAISGWVDREAHWLHEVTPIALALLVVALGKWITYLKAPKTHEEPEATQQADKEPAAQGHRAKEARRRA